MFRLILTVTRCGAKVPAPTPVPPVAKGEPGTIIKVPPGKTEKAETVLGPMLLLSVYTKVVASSWAWTLAVSGTNQKITTSAAGTHLSDAFIRPPGLRAG